MTKIGIIGGGAWGTALGQSFAKNGHDILIWARESDVVSDINENSQNARFLPGIDLHENIKATESLADSVDCDIILLVTPAQFVRSTLKALSSNLTPGKPVIICSKGLEIETGGLLSQVAKEELDDTPIGVMSGPTFAIEVAKGFPAAMTMAIEDKDIGQDIVDSINSQNLRIYTASDMIGLQIGGAVKNVIAIACGVAKGFELGQSTQAALMTRGLAEMARLVSAMDGKKTTLMGMCGFGDLVLTCTSEQSRNFSLGFALGQGQSIEDLLKQREGKCVTEGYHTARAVRRMASNHAVDMPISMAVYESLHESKPLQQSMEELLERPVKSGFK